MGGTYDKAARLLGITPVQTHLLSARETRRSGRTGCNPLEFDRALRALASELQSARQPLVAHRRRREALQEWILGIDAWNALVSELPPTLVQFRTRTYDRKRQNASVFVWTLVTRGEDLFAPRPLEAAQPTEIQQQCRAAEHHMVPVLPPRPTANTRTSAESSPPTRGDLPGTSTRELGRSASTEPGPVSGRAYSLA